MGKNDQSSFIAASKVRRENLGIFRRYPLHEPTKAIVLACILRHVGATHDDITHRKLPRWVRIVVLLSHAPLRPASSLNSRSSLNRGASFGKVHCRFAAKSRDDVLYVSLERETRKLLSECIGLIIPLSEFCETSAMSHNCFAY